MEGDSDMDDTDRLRDPPSEDWEAVIEELAPADVDVGDELARDAIRVARGELTPEAFYRKYHQRGDEP